MGLDGQSPVGCDAPFDGSMWVVPWPTSLGCPVPGKPGARAHSKSFPGFRDQYPQKDRQVSGWGTTQLVTPKHGSVSAPSAGANTHHPGSSRLSSRRVNRESTAYPGIATKALHLPMVEEVNFSSSMPCSMPPGDGRNRVVLSTTEHDRSIRNLAWESQKPTFPPVMVSSAMRAAPRR